MHYLAYLIPVRADYIDLIIAFRSIPKHAVLEVDPVKEAERRTKHCIFEPEVYDKMLDDSLLVCDMLKTHLEDCIVSVRTKSPTPQSPERMVSQAERTFTVSPESMTLL